MIVTPELRRLSYVLVNPYDQSAVIDQTAWEVWSVFQGEMRKVGAVLKVGDYWIVTEPKRTSTEFAGLLDAVESVLGFWRL